MKTKRAANKKIAKQKPFRQPFSKDKSIKKKE